FGAELCFDEGDTTPPLAVPSVKLNLKLNDGVVRTPLTLNKKDLTFQSEEVRLANDLIIARGGALEFQPNNTLGTDGTLPGAPAEPWRIYHNVTRPNQSGQSSQ